ncbi:unnamed protein product [Amoebophrya sp. A25]|nr:unnamed protein product [Amoebophrya sp. A25]|eukprot:GSA25T00003429001.1
MTPCYLHPYHQKRSKADLPYSTVLFESEEERQRRVEETTSGALKSCYGMFEDTNISTTVKAISIIPDHPLERVIRRVLKSNGGPQQQAEIFFAALMPASSEKSQEQKVNTEASYQEDGELYDLIVNAGPPATFHPLTPFDGASAGLHAVGSHSHLISSFRRRDEKRSFQDALDEQYKEMLAKYTSTYEDEQDGAARIDVDERTRNPYREDFWSRQVEYLAQWLPYIDTTSFRNRAAAKPNNKDHILIIFLLQLIWIRARQTPNIVLDVEKKVASRSRTTSSSGPRLHYEMDPAYALAALDTSRGHLLPLEAVTDDVVAEMRRLFAKETEEGTGNESSTNQKKETIAPEPPARTDTAENFFASTISSRDLFDEDGTTDVTGTGISSLNPAAALAPEVSISDCRRKLLEEIDSLQLLAEYRLLDWSTVSSSLRPVIERIQRRRLQEGRDALKAGSVFFRGKGNTKATSSSSTSPKGAASKTTTQSRYEEEQLLLARLEEATGVSLAEKLPSSSTFYDWHEEQKPGINENESHGKQLLDEALFWTVLLGAATSNFYSTTGIASTCGGGAGGTTATTASTNHSTSTSSSTTTASTNYSTSTSSSTTTASTNYSTSTSTTTSSACTTSSLSRVLALTSSRLFEKEIGVRQLFRLLKDLLKCLQEELQGNAMKLKEDEQGEQGLNGEDNGNSTSEQDFYHQEPTSSEEYQAQLLVMMDKNLYRLLSLGRLELALAFCLLCGRELSKYVPTRAAQFRQDALNIVERRLVKNATSSNLAAAPEVLERLLRVCDML